MKSVTSAQAGSKKRGLLWHLKWLFACYAASFGLFLIAFLVSLPFAGVAFSAWWFGSTGSYAMLALAVVISPIIHRTLR